MQPHQLLQLAAAAWKGPALCPYCGIYISQSVSSHDQGAGSWYVSLRLARPAAEGPAQPDYKGFAPYPFQALREAFRALRAVAPGYAFVALWEVLKAEDEYAGVPSHV